ncbi:MAG: dihydroneopterin aldolase [Akkermansiaceae bacterium]|nr:dihydroneopterin aldolase [Akkermansiaceae bacterium]
MKEEDQIFIRGQKVSCHIGVPDEERAAAQELIVHTRFSSSISPQSFDDQIDQTVDYHAVYLRINEVAAIKPRRLIETLAEDLASMILAEFQVAEVSIEIEKFILPNTQCVGVAITRKNAH